ncbi:MAG: ABC transporter permease [Prevotellaceae bacterium]|jgi:ABC-type transport system involved in multi-copper enzyme maturation permease subunit|nr:ABC transporter permease [Prevotellaceae bacterium]
MFKILFIRELQNYLYSLRFQISFVIVTLVFIFGTIFYIVSTGDKQDNYNKFVQEQEKQLEERIGNAGKVAVSRTNYILSPKSYAVIDDCKENILPNSLSYSAYNVWSFNVKTASSNPYLKKAQGLNWAFIISTIISFITLLFAFDAISGEKEDHTLSLVFSNKVSRASFILSKFLSILTVMFCTILVGVIVSLLIISFSSKITINSYFLGNTLGFLSVCLLFISVMAIIGLLASTLSKQSNISLLICLTIWIFFAVVLPNASVFIATKFFAIPTAKEVNDIIKAEQDDIYKNAPEGSWSSYGGQPFYPAHELRANNQSNLFNAEKKHKDAYYNQMFRQFENTRIVAIFSPIMQFDCINEGALGGGYLRFRKNWNDLHIFQESFLKWFKDLDARDEKSPHWYNPYEIISTTQQAVSLDQIPHYTEKAATLAERIAYSQNYLIAMIALFGIVFAFCFVRFLRYDVR